MQNDTLTDRYSIRLITKLQLMNIDVHSKVDLSMVRIAMLYAKKYHGLQMRQSGEPFYSHTFAVAEKLSKYYFQTDAIVAAIIHDIVEDTVFNISQVGFVFNQNIKDIVNRLSKIDITNKRKLSAEWVLYKLSQDKIATTIKLLDRMHNMETIFHIQNEHKRIRIAQETIQCYVPLAQIMNLDEIKDVLLKLSYKVLNNSISS